MAYRVYRLTEADIPGAPLRISAVGYSICLVAWSPVTCVWPVVAWDATLRVNTWEKEAFADDPYNNWVFDKSEFDHWRNAASLAIRCRWGMRNGIFHIVKEKGSDEVLGVACWLKPHGREKSQSWHDWFEGWRLWLNQLGMNIYYGRGGLDVKRYYIWKEAQEAVQKAVWTDPRGYYFLNIMVVLPKAQGKGIGRLLMKAVTDRADKENMSCYLESSREVPNMQIYRRFGFQFVKELTCDDNGDAIKLFAMIREPNATPHELPAQPLS